MKDHIIFDTTNASTIIDSDNVGAFVRANDGALITKHSLNEQTSASLITQGLVLTSKLPGAIGNTYSFTVVSTTPGATSFTEVGGAIVVDLHTNTVTLAQLVTLLSSSAYVNAYAGTPAGNIVAASILPLAGGTDTSVHQHLDVYAAMAAADGTPFTYHTDGGSTALDVHVTNPMTINVDINGIYDGATNTTPANVGLIGSTRTAPGLPNQTLQFTGAAPTADAVSPTLIVAQDVNAFGMMWDSGTSGWDRLTGSGGNLNVNVAGFTGGDPELATGTIVSHTNTLGVANTAQNVTATALAGRKYLWIYNFDNNKIFIGGSGVTLTNGYPMSPGSEMQLRAGAAQNVCFVGSNGKTPEIRTLEQA